MKMGMFIEGEDFSPFLMVMNSAYGVTHCQCFVDNSPHGSKTHTDFSKIFPGDFLIRL
jgi:hypothetical protein